MLGAKLEDAPIALVTRLGRTIEDGFPLDPNFFPRSLIRGASVLSLTITVMNSSSSSSALSLRLALVALALLTGLNIVLPVFVTLPPRATPSSETSRQERVHGGHPQEWDLPLKQVAITVEDSVNFQLDTVEGTEQWQAIRPPGNDYIKFVEGSAQRYRVAMFHALDCLDTVRQNVLQRKSNRFTLASTEAHFCLDYLRQTIQCRSDTQLEQVRSEYGPKSVQPFVTHNNCRDWSKVYAVLKELEAGKDTRQT